ncbi:hypothetical protein ZWY2020_022960 [Hordeum vulgare]|nr:hypothetical protein ZWY2020_022960 [Hordeum vulgare]
MDAFLPGFTVMRDRADDAFADTIRSSGVPNDAASRAGRVAIFVLVMRLVNTMIFFSFLESVTCMHPEFFMPRDEKLGT